MALIKEFVVLTKALACEKRLRILMALRNRKLCESIVTEMLGLAPATASRHLWLLRQAGLVDSEKTGDGALRLLPPGCCQRLDCCGQDIALAGRMSRPAPADCRRRYADLGALRPLASASRMSPAAAALGKAVIRKRSAPVA